MNKTSAGILAYRISGSVAEVLLVHPGGPFFTKKDDGVWSVPKGEYTSAEDPLTAAIREYAEELGATVQGTFIPLQPVKQKGGKTVYAWIVETDFDITDLSSNTFPLEWPPRSGKIQQFPEVDRAEWFALDVARQKINAAQVAFIDELEEKLKTR